MTKRNSFGFTLISAIIGLIFAGLMLAALGWYAVAHTNMFRTLTDQSQRDAYAGVQKEMVVEGFNPLEGYTPLDGLLASSTSNSETYTWRDSQSPGGSSETVIGITPPGGQNIGSTVPDGDPQGPNPGDGSPGLVVVPSPGSPGGIGVITHPGTDPYNPPAGQLQPPIVNLASGLISPSSFPLIGQDVISPHPDNPPGTLYRYTFAGLPTESSPVWTGSSIVEINEIPHQWAFIATHPDFPTSSTVLWTNHIHVSVEWARATGPQDNGFTYEQATGLPSQQGITLALNVSGLDLPIHYFYGPMSGHNYIPFVAGAGDSQAYSGAFLPSLQTWTDFGGAIPLHATIENPRQGPYRDPIYAESPAPGTLPPLTTLQTIQTQLDPATLLLGASQISETTNVYDGDRISLQHDLSHLGIQVEVLSSSDPYFGAGIYDISEDIDISLPLQDP